MMSADMTLSLVITTETTSAVYGGQFDRDRSHQRSAHVASTVLIATGNVTTHHSPLRATAVTARLYSMTAG